MELAGELQAAGVTAREAEVFGLLASRLTNTEIAERLFISVRTVESHVSSLLRKLDEPDRRALATRAQALSATSTGELPRTLRQVTGGVPLVGRADELARLEQLAGITRARGSRHVALVVGDAGIGKTRLAAEAALHMHDGGAEVMHGRCAEDVTVPYVAIAEAIRPILGDSRDPFATPADGFSDAGGERYRLFEAADRAIASRPGLVALVLDDVQWIDASGVQLLLHLMRHADRSSLLIIATARPEAADPHHRLGATLAAADAIGALELITLEGLTSQEARTFAAHLGAGDHEHAVAAWERTAGNPFLLEALLQHDHGGAGLPPSARDAIVRRVAGLGPAVFDVLAAAAVAGEVFRARDVTDMTGSDGAVESLTRAFGAGLLVEDGALRGSYRFAHSIVRDALSAVITPTQRSRLHLRAAAVLEAHHSTRIADIAHHRHAALPDGDPDQARDAALHAHDDAMARLAFEMAAGFADLALDAVDTEAGHDRQRAEIVLRRGRANLRAGDLQRANDDFQEAFELAHRHGDDQIAGAAVLGWADTSAVWGRNPELRTAVETVLRRMDDVALRARLKAKLAQLLYYEGDAQRRRQLTEEAVADARDSGRDDTLAAVLATAHAAVWDPADLEQRTGAARQIVDMAATSGSAEIEIQGLGWLIIDLLEAGDLAGSDDLRLRHAVLARRLQHRLGLRDAELWAAMRSTLEGRFDEAQERIERARDLGETAHDPATDSIYWVQRYWLAVERGQRSEMDELVEPCERIIATNPDVPAWGAALAMLHARRGDRTAATAVYEPLAADRFNDIPRDVVWLNAMTYLAETCAYLDDADRASALVRALDPYATRVALIDRGFACKGAIQRFLGLLSATAGDHASAARHLTLALARHEQMGALPLTLRTQQDLERL